MQENGRGVITKLERTKRGRFSVFVDGEFLFSIDGETLLNSDIREGREIAYSDLEAVARHSDFISCREKALRLLGMRDYAQGELVNRLARDFERDICVEVCEKLRESGLLDDAVVATRLAAELYQFKHLSKRFVRAELQKRGLGQSEIEDAMYAADIDDVVSIRALCETNYRRRLTVPDGRNKVMAALARRGFSYSDCDAVLREFREEDGEYEYAD